MQADTFLQAEHSHVNFKKEYYGVGNLAQLVKCLSYSKHEDLN